MLGLGLQATLTNEGGGIAKKQPVKDGLVMYHQYQDFPTDSLRLSFPSEGSGEFNGTSDYVQLPTPFSYTNHTIAAWVYIDETPVSTKIFFDNRDANDDGIIFLINTTENIRYSVNATDLSTNTLPINEWVYVVGTYDGTTAKLYFDGSLNDSTAISTTINVATNLVIGAEADFTNNFDGNLANVAIWNRALTSDEINTAMWASYDQLPTSIKVGLQAWYALDNITGTDVPDSTGNYNGTAY